MKQLLLIFIIVFYSSCSSFRNIKKDDFILIKNFSECNCVSQYVGNRKVIEDNFVRKILLGNTLSEIRSWSKDKKISFFDKLYRQACITATYEHPNGDLYHFPFDAICPAFEHFIDKQPKVVRVSPSEKELYIGIELLNLTCNIKYEKKLIIEGNAKNLEFSYSIKKLDDNLIDTIKIGEIENEEEFLSILFDKYNILDIPSNTEIVNFHDRSAGCYYYLFDVYLNGKFDSFLYRDLYDDCGPKSELIKNLIFKLEKYFDLSPLMSEV